MSNALPPQLSTLVDLYRRVHKNSDVARALWRVLRASSQEDRLDALADVETWALRKQLDAQLEQGIRAAKGAASTLIQAPQVYERLRETPHLGCLAPMSRLTTTRLDYVALQLKTLLEIKETFPGLGLSSTRVARSIRYNKRDISALELAQCWAILRSVGHLFGTFATERALVFHLQDTPELRREAPTTILTAMKPHVERVVARPSMYTIADALSAWWVSHELTDPSLRNFAGLALNSWFEAGQGDERLAKLRAVYSIARKVALLKLHQRLKIGTGADGVDAESLLRGILHDDGVAFDAHTVADTRAQAFLDEIVEFQYRAAFASPEAAELVLTHMREFRAWTQTGGRHTADFGSKVRALLRRPTDWPQQPARLPEYWFRADLPGSDGELVHEVKRWRGDGSKWQEATFYMSSSPSRPGLSCDFFASDRVAPVTLCRIATLLAEKCEASWSWRDDKDDALALWRSIARFGGATFDLALRNHVQLRVVPVRAERPSAGFAMLARSRGAIESRMQQFMDRVSDDGRRKELLGVLDVLRTQPEEGVCLLFLGKTLIVSVDEERPLQELDGLWARFSEQSVEWHALECKSGDASGARGQLAQINELLKVPVSLPEEREVQTGRAWHVHFIWERSSDAMNLEGNVVAPSIP